MENTNKKITRQEVAEKEMEARRVYAGSLLDEVEKKEA